MEQTFSGERRGAPRPRILIVHDSADVATGLQLAVAAWGYEVRLALDGTDALNTARCWRPHVVVLRVGQSDAFDGCSIARRLTEAGSRARLVMLGSAEQEDAAVTVGAVCCVNENKAPSIMAGYIRNVLMLGLPHTWRHIWACGTYDFRDAGITIRIELDGATITSDDGRVIVLQPLEAQLVSRLLWTPSELVPVALLAVEVWGWISFDDETSGPAQKSLYRLRNALGEVGGNVAAELVSSHDKAFMIAQPAVC